MENDHSDSWNKQEVRTLCQSSENTLAFFTELARRKRTTWETTVDFLVDNYGFSRKEARQLFSSLQDCECGQHIVGRKGYATRFEWTVRAIDVARDALKHVIEIEHERGAAARVSIGTENQHSGSQLKRYCFPLRPGLDMNLDLPADLTEDEVVRLTLFLHSLPHTSKVPARIRSAFASAQSGASDLPPSEGDHFGGRLEDELCTIPIEEPSPSKRDANHSEITDCAESGQSD